MSVKEPYEITHLSNSYVALIEQENVKEPYEITHLSNIPFHVTL